MRPFLLALGAWGCCCGGAAPTAENYVPVPSTVQEAQALHDPPATVVTVSREDRPSGGGACGHSPVCLLILPMMAWEAVFPPKVDVVDIVYATGPKVHGEYAPDGDLLWAEHTEAGVVRAARLLVLPALDRRLVLESAQATVANGVVGTFEPTAIQSQVDLVAAYETKLNAQPTDHDELLDEATAALRVEALPLLERWLPKPEEGPAKLKLVLRVCQSGGLEGDDLRLRQSVLRWVQPGLPLEIAGLAFKCAAQTPGLSDAEVFAFADQLVGAICENPQFTPLRDWRDHASGQVGLAERAGTRIPNCTRPSRQTLLRHAIYLPVEAGAYTEATRTDPAVRDLLVPLLDARESPQRAALFAAIEAGGALGPSADALLYHEGGRPTPAEAATITAAYLAYSPSMLGRRDPQATALALLARHEGTPEAALAQLHAQSGLSGDQAVVVAAARLVLGDTTQASVLVQNLGVSTCDASSLVVGASGLASRALTIAGCTCEEVNALHLNAGASTSPTCLVRRP